MPEIQSGFISEQLARETAINNPELKAVMDNLLRILAANRGAIEADENLSFLCRGIFNEIVGAQALSATLSPKAWQEVVGDFAQRISELEQHLGVTK